MTRPDRDFLLGGGSHHEHKTHYAHLARALARTPGARVRRDGIAGGLIFLSFDVHAPLVAATPNARYVEFFPDDQVLNFRRLIDRQLAHKDGNLVLHTTPGLAFDFDESAVKKYALDSAKPWTVVR